jgi:hypothetical protein
LTSSASQSSGFVGIDRLLNARKQQTGKERKEDILAATVAWIIEENQPLNATSKKAFRRMIETIDKQSPVLSRENIRDDIKYLGTICRIAIQRELKGKYFSLTTDHWTSPNDEQCIGLKVARCVGLCWRLKFFMAQLLGLNLERILSGYSMSTLLTLNSL